MLNSCFSYLKIGKSAYNGFTKKTIDFVSTVQLKDRNLWRKFVEVYGSGADVIDNGWRGEYWGKMMRGACLTYAYTADRELYSVIEEAVFALLEKQEGDGRISTYPKDNEFRGWDMWCRKYVMVGLEYFYRICNDSLKKQRILTALKAHADYIIKNIGDDKIPITKSSHIYGALNSCSILDAFLQLYLLTKEQRYLDFGKYILDCGGTGEGNLIECLNKGLKPHEFPITKAYEMMSFFEGVLTYYECTGEEQYLHIVQRFFDAINETELAIVGGMGYQHEFFSDTKAMQTETSTEPMLETCVTVTWIRILSRLLALTGEVKYADRIEISTYNALYGTLNFDGLEQFCYEKKCNLPGLPFDSYSPLFKAYRGDRIGGFKPLADGTHYGCCACIAAAAVALFPLGAVMTESEKIVVNYYLDGESKIILNNGEKANLIISTNYPTESKVAIKVVGETQSVFSLKLRIPNWCKKASVWIAGRVYEAEKGYLLLKNVKSDEEIVLDLSMELEKVYLNGKTAFTRGPLVLARDEYKENRKIDFDKMESIETIIELPYCEDEYYRCGAKTEDGEVIILADYKSCGKNWTSEFNLISVWLNVKEQVK